MRDFETTAGPSEADPLSPLFVPIPEGLGEVLGYWSEARFIGMFWSDDADEVILSDGVNREVGESLRFLEYCGHQAVEPELGDLNIGLFDKPATKWLVLDRHSRNLYYADLDMALAFLMRQHESDAVDTGRIQLRDDAQAVVEHQYDPAIDELRAYLQKFLGPNDRE